MSEKIAQPGAYNGDDIGVDEADFWLAKIEASDKMRAAMIEAVPLLGLVLVRGAKGQSEQVANDEDPASTLEVA